MAINVTPVLGSVLLRVPVGTTIVDEMATLFGETSIRAEEGTLRAGLT